MANKKHNYVEHINLMQWQVENTKNRYRFWRTIATVSLTVNGFIFGLLNLL